MLLWIIFACLTAMALTAVLWPFIRVARAPQARNVADTAVYRDQLAEVDADLARGLIDAEEAKAAKTEISRRLLAAAEGAKIRPGSTGVARRGALALVAAVAAIPVLSVVFYLAFGSPAVPDQPVAERREGPETSQRFAELVRRVEERLRGHPEDGRGWDVIAPVYLKQGRYDEAADAFQRALRLLGEDTRRLVGYGEALVLGNNGIVTEKARAAFEKALQSQAALPKARYWLAVAQEQDGRFDEAAKVWRNMLSNAPADAPWRPLVRQRLRLAEAKLGAAAQTEGGKRRSLDDAPAPTQEDIAAAQQMTAEERRAMINQMVEGLAKRLEGEGQNLHGWLRLVRAYTVLGKREKAIAALKSARAIFNSDRSALDELAALEKSLGLQETFR